MVVVSCHASSVNWPPVTMIVSSKITHPLEPLATLPTRAHHFFSSPLTSYLSQGNSLVSMIARGSDLTESTDPDVRMAYRSICQGGTLNWLALTYGKWSPGLRMSAAGSQGLSELKQSIMNSEQSVTFAFCRISVDGIDCFATITYIPKAHPACEEHERPWLHAPFNPGSRSVLSPPWIHP
ncbi:hypothetical protein BGY98DRAFT_301279 [Russula aff. rugulosa BPL654]|nr:hypothetical protein BGY98DRAFT_301279 [Russula aff. rugulosa BPL654]